MLDAPGPIFGDLPVVLLQAPPLPFLPGLTHRYHRATVAAIDAGHKEFGVESRRGTLIKVEDTGHNIQGDKPEVVMDAILDVLAGQPHLAQPASRATPRVTSLCRSCVGTCPSEVVQIMPPHLNASADPPMVHTVEVRS